jgi:hypothetical protein
MTVTAQRSARPWLWASVACFVLVGAIAVGLWAGLRSTKRQLAGYCGVKLGDSREEVRYRLGFPPFVVGEPEILAGDPKNHWARIFNTDSTADPKNVMPSDKHVEDFFEWSYPFDVGAPNGPNVEVDFSKSNRLVSIQCIDPSHVAAKSCPPLVGFRMGSSEEEITQRLGNPSRSEIDGISKRIRYDDLGVEFLLEKGAVYGLTLTKRSGGDLALVRELLGRMVRKLP